MDDNFVTKQETQEGPSRLYSEFFSMQRANVNLLGFWFMGPLFLPPVHRLTLLWSDILLQ